MLKGFKMTQLVEVPIWIVFIHLIFMLIAMWFMVNVGYFMNKNRKNYHQVIDGYKEIIAEITEQNVQTD